MHLWCYTCNWLCISYQVHTWINPYCSVKLLDGTVNKAVAFSKLGLNLLNSEVSMNVSSKIKFIHSICYVSQYYKFIYPVQLGKCIGKQSLVNSSLLLWCSCKLKAHKEEAMINQLTRSKLTASLQSSIITRFGDLPRESSGIHKPHFCTKFQINIKPSIALAVHKQSKCGEGQSTFISLMALFLLQPKLVAMQTNKSFIPSCIFI